MAAGGLKSLDDCFQSDPAVDARPRRFPIELAAPGPQAATELSWFADRNRPIPVIGTREHRMTAAEHAADVRLSSQRSSPSEQSDLAATPDARPCASALGDAGRYPGRGGIQLTFQGLSRATGAKLEIDAP